MGGRWSVIGMALLATSALTRPPADPAQALAAQLRGFVLDFMPDPLFEDASKWNQQKSNLRGQMKNDGRWLKYKITSRNLRDGMSLTVEDVRKEASKTNFVVKIAFDANAEMQRQTWKNGLRLYSGSTRARFRIYLTLQCELTTRVEKGKGWLPDMVFRMRVINSRFRYDNVVVEHTAGVGGDLARLLGEAMRSMLKAAKPDLERDLIKKVNAAIVKAGDTKEVRVKFGDLLSGKAVTKPPPAAPKK